MFQDLRFGARMLLKNPGFTLIIVLTLALGIGAVAAIFSVVDAVLWRPLPAPRPERLVALYTSGEDGSGYRSLSYPDYAYYRDNQKSLEGLAAYVRVPLNWRDGDRIEQIGSELVTGNFFGVLGLRAAAGRLFTVEDDRTPGAHPVAVISHRLWRERFNADPRALGQTLNLNNNYYTIIGVAPAGYSSVLLDWGKQPEVWLPMMMQPQALPTGANMDLLSSRDAIWLMALGRLKDGVKFEQAEAEIKILAAQLENQWPQQNAGRKGILLPGSKARFWPEYRHEITRILTILGALAALTLLVACSNVANLLLARAAGRRKETGVRLALGAGRWRLARQWLTESLLLSLIGAGAGLLVAAWMIKVLTAFQLPFKIRLAIEPRLDPRALLFTLLAAVTTSLIFGLAPAWRAARLDLAGSLKEGGEFGGKLNRFSLGNLFVVAQVALSLALLAGAGLLARSLWNLRNINLGFNSEHALLAAIRLDPREFNAEQGLNFYQRLLDRVRSMPGIESASLTNNVPINRVRMQSPPVAAEGAEPQRKQDWPSADPNYISPDYFRTLGVSLPRGRDFDARDRTKSEPVAIVNQTLANKLWPNQEAVGRRMKFAGQNEAVTVIGVAPDMKYHALTEPPTYHYYLPIFQRYIGGMTLQARTVGEPLSMAAAMRAAVRETDPRVLVNEISTINGQIDFALSQPRMAATFSGLLAILAMALAAMGLSGVIAYSVSRRTREIGVRLALGARPQDVLRLVVRQGMTLALVGVAFGLIASVALTRLMKTLLFGVTSTDPLTLVAVA
ncbi:MAG: ABC transporter permease, partial [Chloracidobacterium sp.]|nr:ABC transporter permease [Chloracidobacterium sp.]